MTETEPSLLSWERGLKYLKRVKKVNGMESLLSWERGLKSFEVCTNIFCNVAPLVGAWIEIIYPEGINYVPESLLSWERGLKLNQKIPVK